MQKLEGTAIAELVEGGKLKKADILLAHYKRSFWGWLVRLGTRCYWNHAFIIYRDGNLKEGNNKVLIIDPKMGSIRMDDIAHYFENPTRYDVAVKRLSKGWFQNDVEFIGKSYRQTVCDIALQETTSKFDARFIRILQRLLRQLRLIYRYTRRRIKYPRSSQEPSLPIGKRLKISAYSCSGFVQWCYYQGVLRMLKESKDRDKLNDVVFNHWLVEPITHHDLLSTSPADLAKSDKLSWKYVIKDGVVWEVSSEKEVNSILKSRN